MITTLGHVSVVTDTQHTGQHIRYVDRCKSRDETIDHIVSEDGREHAACR